MAEKTTRTQTTKSQFTHLTSLIDSVKNDALVQFGEVKKDFGSIGSTLSNHEGRITSLEKDKIERDAIIKYQQAHPDQGQPLFESSKPEYNNSGTISVNKDLLKAIGYLVVALGVIVAALAATKRL